MKAIPTTNKPLELKKFATDRLFTDLSFYLGGLNKDSVTNLMRLIGEN